MHPVVLRTVGPALEIDDPAARHAFVRDAAFELVEAESSDGRHAVWPDHLGDLLDAVPLSPDHQQWILQSATWRARYRGLDDPLADVGARELVDAPLWRLYTACYFRRFEFRFGSLRTLVRLALMLHPDEDMLRCFDVFASLGLRDPGAAADLAALVEDGPRGLAMGDVLLHGAWLSSAALPDQDGWILRLAEDQMRGGDHSPNVHFWRSSALRRRGEYEAALRSVDLAIEGRTLRDNHVHQDYTRERELILATASIAKLITSETAAAKQELMDLHEKNLAEAQRGYDTRAAAAENVVAKSLTGVVEILGVFLALVAFLAGSGYLAVQADDYVQLLVGLGALAGGTLLLVVALRVIVRPKAPT